MISHLAGRIAEAIGLLFAVVVGGAEVANAVKRGARSRSRPIERASRDKRRMCRPEFKR